MEGSECGDHDGSKDEEDKRSAPGGAYLGMGWDGMGWDGIGWDWMGGDRTGWKGLVWDGVGPTRWDGMEGYGIVQSHSENFPVCQASQFT